MECRLFDPSNPPDRSEDAPQLDEGRVSDLLNLIHLLLTERRPELESIESIVDMAAGDGRLLANLPHDLVTWGYESSAHNVAIGQAEHGVDIRVHDVTGPDLAWADLAIFPECMANLRDPHAMVRRAGRHSRFILVSTPAFETAEDYNPRHLWSWDVEGLKALLAQGRYKTIIHTMDLESNLQIAIGERT